MRVLTNKTLRVNAHTITDPAIRPDLRVAANAYIVTDLYTLANQHKMASADTSAESHTIVYDRGLPNCDILTPIRLATHTNCIVAHMT
jgi:hypothetical protein